MLYDPGRYETVFYPAMQTPDVRAVILVIACCYPRHREERSDPRHREERSDPRHREERSDVAISQRWSLCQSEQDCHALRARNDSRRARNDSRFAALCRCIDGHGCTVSAAHQQFAARHVIVMAAPNGARRGHDDHAALPVTPREIADCAADLLDAGVSVLHLHVRDSDGQHTLDADCYRNAIRHIRQRVGDNLILQVTTEAVGRYKPDEQMAMVRDVKPEAVSIALRELCPDDAAEKVASGFFHWAVRERIWSQYIVYSPDELVRFDTLRRQGLFGEEHPFCLLVLGRYADGQLGDPEELHRMLRAVDSSSFPWATCCFGPREHEAMTVALAGGGHARIGFENNLLLADGRLARDNAELVSQFVTAVKASPRTPASADDIRGKLLVRAS